MEEVLHQIPSSLTPREPCWHTAEDVRSKPELSAIPEKERKSSHACYQGLAAAWMFLLCGIKFPGTVDRQSEAKPLWRGGEGSERGREASELTVSF